VECLQKALALIEGMEEKTRYLRTSRREKAFILRTLGEVQGLMGDLPTSVRYLEQAIPIFRELNHDYAVQDTTQHLFNMRRRKTLDGSSEGPTEGQADSARTGEARASLIGDLGDCARLGLGVGAVLAVLGAVSCVIL
jgi:hypothetical protein